MKRIKKCNDELKANRPTPNEVAFIPRLPISIIVENVRSVYNVGSIFRSADGFGAEKIYLTGYTACPPRADLHKTALGAEDVVPWEYYENSCIIAKKLNNKGVNIALIEQTKMATSIFETNIKFPICFIMGNEVDGVSEELIKYANVHLEIPMRGIKQSLNVSVACGVIGYELSRIYNKKTI